MSAFFLCLLSSTSIFAAAQNNSSQSTAKPAPDYGKLPLSFEANQGQVDAQVRFTSRGNGYSLFLTDKEAVLALSKREESKGAPTPAAAPHTLAGKAAAKDVLKTDVVRMQLAGADPELTVKGEQPLPGIANYFIGSDPAKWHANIPTYAKVKYAAVYPGVDLVYYGNQGQLEYDFVVAPGADPKQVKLHFAGAEKLKLNSDGDLTVIAKNGEIAFHKPAVYQFKGDRQVGKSAGQRQTVEGRFTLLAKNTVGFQLGEYDASRAVVIDPALAYSTYLGGSGSLHGGGETSNGIAVDASGNAYVTGSTGSTDFPVTKGAFQTSNHSDVAAVTNAFVSKLNPSGTSLIYSTYLGGSVEDYASGIAVDALGNAYLTGYATSSDFPVTKGAFQTINKVKTESYGNAFVTKLNPSGSSLLYSTYLGGSDDDYGVAIAIDGLGDAYVTGSTASTDFPVTKGAFQTVNKEGEGGGSAFVTKLNALGSSLIYSSYLGGAGDAEQYGTGASGIALDASGDAYAVGSTYSTDFPVTKGAFQTVNHGAAAADGNAFVTKFNPSGSALMYSTYLGGSGGNYIDQADSASQIAVDASGNAYLTGTAISSNFPVTKGAFQTINRGALANSSNAFVTKLNPSGSALIYSTFLGGSVGDGGSAIAIDASGNAYLTGVTSSLDFPLTKDAFQTLNDYTVTGGSSAFMTKLNASGSSLLYSTYLGQGGLIIGSAVAVDASGDVFLTGETYSNIFPVTNGAFQTIRNPHSAQSAFVTKFSFTANQVFSYYYGFTNAQGPIQFNGSTRLGSSPLLFPTLQLTNGGANERGSAFFATPVNIDSFHTEFRFQLSSLSSSPPLANIADGITFTIQNAGPDALGENGQGLGYNGIGNSVAIKFDLHNNDGEGPNSTGLYTDGRLPTVPAIDLTGTGINLHSGDLFDASLTYDGTNLVLILRDTVTNAAYTHSFAIDIPTTVGGDTAYVGFTGASGAETANQQIIGWTFTNP